MLFDGGQLGHYCLSENREAESLGSSFDLLAAILASARQYDQQHKALVLDRLDQISSALDLLTNQGSREIQSTESAAHFKTEPHVFTREELAERWNVSKATVQRMEKRGEIQAMNIGGGVRITLQSVLEYEKNAKH